MKLPEHKCGLSLEHNQHRNVYESAKHWIEENSEWCDRESDETKERAIEKNSIWTLQWYPETPIGFICVAAPTLEEVLALAEKMESR